MPRVAFMTYGELVEPAGGKRVREFHERTPGVFRAAAGTPGHLATAETGGWARGERIEHLHEHGPTPYAFDVRTPFDARGERVTLER